MIERRAALILLGAALLGRNGYSGDDSLSGVWGFKDSLGGLGGGNLTLRQSGVASEGTWDVVFQTFAGRAKYNNSGSLTGTVDGASISLMMTSSQGSCSYNLDATRSGRKLSGTYSAIDCATPQTGRVDLERM